MITPQRGEEGATGAMIAGELQSENRKHEECLLALCLRSEGAVHEAIGLGIEPSIFFDRGHRRIWSGFLEDIRAGYCPDEGTLLDRHGADIGPTKPWTDLASLNAAVQRLTALSPRRAHLKRYAEGIAEASCRRQVLDGARRVLSLNDEGVGTTALVEESQRFALAASQGGVKVAKLLTMEQIAREACDRAEALAAGREPDTVIPTGLRHLDGQFRARRGDYILIGARPSMGKSHFMLSIMAQIAKHSGPFQLNSVEMRESALGDRIHAHDAGRGWDRSEDTARAASEAVLGRWMGLPIRVDTEARSLAQVTSSLRAAKQRDGIVAAGIDYLQLLRLPKGNTREQEVAHASRELAALAGELDIVLFVACQLSRALEQRSLRERRPRMSDLRESGQLEQDADGILFLFREAAYNPAVGRPEILEVGIAKQRNGRAPRTAFCRYVPGEGYVKDLSPGDEMRAASGVLG